MNERQKLVQHQFLDNEETVIKRLNQVYSKSLDDINTKIKKLSFKIGELQQEYDWMDPDDPERAKVKSMIQSKIYQKQYQEQLQKQVGGILDKMNIAQFTNIADYLDTCYTDGFIGTIFDAHGQGVPILAPINQESMVRAVQLESKISKGLYTRLGEDVDLLKKKITAQISRGISTGMTYAQVAKGLENYTRIGYNNSIRIARTEGHRIQTTATMDAMTVAKEKGADVLKQWDATLDTRTRESHQAVDGEVRELDKPFSNGLMYAGDPSGGAAEVVNCRCAILQRARWALGESELQTLKNRAAYFGLDKADEFNDFKQKYLKAVETPSNLTKNYDCDLAKKFGTAYYDELHQLVTDCTDQDAAEVWKKYESQVQVGDANYRGHEHCQGHTIYVNGANDAKGNSFQKPYQVTFHESGHAIDSLARSKVSGGHWFSRHYSSAYKDGLFPQTIKDEVNDWVKAKDKELKALWKEHAGDVEWFHDQGFIGDWYYDMYKRGTYTAQHIIPKYKKSFAYSALEKEVKAAGTKHAIGDLSDILEGATNAKIQCGFGHGATYWRDRTYDRLSDGLATESFAEMIDSTFTNPESLEMIKKYLPKSYEVFQQMLKDLI